MSNIVSGHELGTREGSVIKQGFFHRTSVSHSEVAFCCVRNDPRLFWKYIYLLKTGLSAVFVVLSCFLSR